MSQGLGVTSAARPIVLILIVLGWCRTDCAQDIQLPQSRQGRRTAPILLLSRMEIQKEIDLSPKLIAEAKLLATGLQRKAAELQGKTGPGILMARRSIDHEQTEWLNKNLSPAQIDRLHQLDLQWEGPGALISRPMIAEYLGLTQEQLVATAKLIVERNGRGKQEQESLDSEAILGSKILANLSEHQRSQWTALLGKPFRFQADSPVRDPRISTAGAKSFR